MRTRVVAGAVVEEAAAPVMEAPGVGEPVAGPEAGVGATQPRLRSGATQPRLRSGMRVGTFLG